MNQDVVSTITNAVWNESGSLDITSLTSAVHFISTAVDELRQAPKERVGLLNMLLWKQFGDSIDIYIQDNILKGFSSKRHFQKEEELYHVLDWHHLYYSSFMKAFVQLMKVKLSELSASKGSDETVSADFDEWFDDGLLSYARRCCGGALSGRHVGELRLAATAQIALGRSKFLFEMVAEYPDSLVGLKELRDCLKRSDMVSEVGKRFRIALQKRLLHMGASTTQILDFYVSMIKALRILDPSDFLLNYVAAPVRKYLLSRKDAVRCIVASLTEGRESELHGELKQGGNLAYAPDEDDEEAGPGAHWEPRRRNKELVEPSGKADAASSKGLDTLALLVSIYGSTDLFIVEYRSLLADKLIANVGYATDSEVANLELLKIRYAVSVPSCEIICAL